MLGSGARSIPLAEIDAERAAALVCARVAAVLAVRDRLEAGMKDEGLLALFNDLELPLAYVLAEMEGIIPALESAHALAQAMKMAPGMPKDAILLVNLSGRGDKDMHTVAERSGKKL